MNSTEDTNNCRYRNMAAELLLFCGGSFGGGVGVFFGEAFDAACGVQEFLLTREKRMAVGTDFHAKHIALYGGASRESVPTGAVDGN